MEVHHLMDLARNLMETCPRCFGTGEEPTKPKEPCYRCYGTKYVIKEEFRFLHALVRTLVAQDPEHIP